MRIWNLVVALVLVALGLACWRFGDWTVSDANDGMDGTCQGLQQLLAYGVALVFFAHAAFALFARKRHFEPIADFMTDGPQAPPREPVEITKPGKAFDRLFD